MWLVDLFGYWGIFFGMLIESVCILLLSEVIMLFGGFMVEVGKFNFWFVVFVGIVGNLVGLLIVYYIGKFGGRVLVLKFGKYIFLNVKYLDKVELWFGCYGVRVVFFGWVLLVIWIFIFLLVGIVKMNVWKFVIYMILGCILWNIFLIWFGYLLGFNWSVVEKYMWLISYLMLVLVIVIVVYFVYKVWNKCVRNVK